ncbi:hypothetical protein ACJIZ3_013642 [Penstemon smallii]|uniref:Protein kinase domain-containing protein n=1 Tax=Penstemon smallii TaxID=265156 RepID=A0ABD3RHF2_9LAMI
MKSELHGFAGWQAEANPANVMTNDQNDENRCPRNISIQTGEEFSPDFLRDRTRRMPFANDFDQSPRNRTGLDFVQNHHLGYEDQIDSESGIELSDISPSKGYGMNVDYKTCLDTGQRYYRDFQVSVQHQRKFSNDIDKGSPSGLHIYSSDSPNSHQYYNKGSGIRDDSFSGKIKFLCSFGGRILPRPNDGKLRYVGGETRIISIRKKLTYSELVKKTSAICNQPHTIKYQLPGEDLDALISVSSDEDLHHMIEEYHELERSSQRLRIFLVSFSDNEGTSSLEGRTIQQSDADYQYVVAVNGLMDPSPQRSSSRESLASQSAHLDGGSSLNLNLMLSGPTSQGFNAPQVPTSPVRFKDTNTSYMKGNENEYVVGVPAYENPYCVDATGYYQNHPINNVPVIGSPKQNFHVPESYATPNLRSHFHKSSKDFEVHSPFAPSGLKRGFLNAVPLHSDKLVPSQDTIIFSPASQRQHEDRPGVSVEGTEQKSPWTFDAEKFPSLAASSSSSEERVAHQPMTLEKYQTFQNKDEFSRETPNLERNYTEWGQDRKKGTFFYQDIDNDYVLNASYLEHRPNLPKIICQPDSNLGIHLPTSLQQIDGGNESSSSSSNSTGNQSEVWKELPEYYQVREKVPEFLIKSQKVRNDQKHHITNEGNNNRSQLIRPVFPKDKSSFGSELIREHYGLVNNSDESTMKDSHGCLKIGENEKGSYKLNSRNDIFDQSESSDNCRETGVPEIPVIVEDVTDRMPTDAPSSSSAIPHIQDEPSDHGEETENESIIAESDSDDVKVDQDNKDESISDAAIIEMEAGIYGLQIIKNADLEDQHELGSGTYGTVYHGKWRGTDVAVKRIKKSCFAGRSSEQERLTKDFWREAQILSKLHHPNVVAFYGVVPDGPDGTLATVTEYMANGSLRHVLLRKDRGLDRRKKVIIALDAAFGMEYLHLKNIVHFDLKCDNLLVNLGDPQRPVCKVGDFGLSRIKRNTLVSGGVRGTLPWMAPELLNGSSSRVSEKVDVFSFGIAMWEILTGEEPYANMHCGAIIGGIVNNTLRPPIPERCDPEWRKLVEECWSHDPAARPSFTEITNRLRVMSTALQPKRYNNNRVKR